MMGDCFWKERLEVAKGLHLFLYHCVVRSFIWWERVCYLSTLKQARALSKEGTTPLNFKPEGAMEGGSCFTVFQIPHRLRMEGTMVDWTTCLKGNDSQLRSRQNLPASKLCHQLSGCPATWTVSFYFPCTILWTDGSYHSVALASKSGCTLTSTKDCTRLYSRDVITTVSNHLYTQINSFLPSKVPFLILK